MEDINITMDRVNTIWRESDDKESLAQSFGFPTVDNFVLSVNAMYQTGFKDSLEMYAEKFLELNEDDEITDELSEQIMLFALADVVMVSMMMGRERERVEKNDASN